MLVHQAKMWDNLAYKEVREHEIPKRFESKAVEINIVSLWRWIVERTFGWQNNYRRLSKDYEITTSSEENYVMIANPSTLLRRCGDA